MYNNPAHAIHANTVMRIQRCTAVCRYAREMQLEDAVLAGGTRAAVCRWTAGSSPPSRLGP